MTDELKPCPMCGKMLDVQTGYKGYYIKCDCAKWGDCRIGMTDRDKDVLIARWNFRGAEHGRL